MPNDLTHNEVAALTQEPQAESPAKTEVDSEWDRATEWWNKFPPGGCVNQMWEEAIGADVDPDECVLWLYRKYGTVLGHEQPEAPAQDAGPSDTEMLDCLHEHHSKINQVEPPDAFPEPDCKWVIFLDGGDFIFAGKTFRDAARAFFAAMKEQGR